jgi:hypothetical protein
VTLIRRALLLFTAALLALAPGTGLAQALAKADPRALAMGGGFVALADGWAALQWNPAGLWVSGRKEAAVTYGSLRFEGGPWVDSLRAGRGFPTEVSPRDAALTLASRGAGLAGELLLGAYIATPRFGGGFQQTYYVDEVSRLRDGRVEIDAAVLRTRELQFSGAHPLAEGRVVIGGTAKIVRAQTRLSTTPLQAIGPDDLTATELLRSARRGATAGEDTLFSVDVGVLVIPSARFRFGGVVKNVNAPELASAPAGFTRLPRQIRVGGVLLPHPSLRLAVDLDLSTDTFFADGRERREVGGGIEWSADALALRGGLLFDLKAIERRPLYTFGLGLGGETIRADLAASWAPERDGFGWLGALAAEF